MKTSTDMMYLHRSEPAPRAVLGDWLEERGRGGLGWLKRVAERNADAAADADTAGTDAGVEVYRHTPVYEASVEKARDLAGYIQESFGAPQKLVAKASWGF